MIVGAYSQRETDGQKVRVGDEKLLIKAADLEAIIPTVDDYLVAGAVKRLVVDIKLDPTGTLYTVQARKQIMETALPETEESYRLQLKAGSEWVTLGVADTALNLNGTRHRVKPGTGPQLQDSETELWHTYAVFDGQLMLNPVGEA